MNSKIKSDLKKIAEQALLDAKMQAALDQLDQDALMRAQQQADAVDEDDASLPTEAVQVQCHPVHVLNNHLETVIEAYKTWYGKEPEISEEDAAMTFFFKTKDEAARFFTAMADQRQLFYAMDAMQGINGLNYFSCGDGKLYQGSLLELKQRLQQVLEDDPDNDLVQDGLNFILAELPQSDLNPTAVFREALKTGSETKLEPEHHSTSPSRSARS